MAIRLPCASVADLYLRDTCEASFGPPPPELVGSDSPAWQASPSLFERSMMHHTRLCVRCAPDRPSCCESPEDQFCFRDLSSVCATFRTAIAAVGIHGVLSAMDRISLEDLGCWDGLHAAGAIAYAHSEMDESASKGKSTLLSNVLLLCRTLRNPELSMACSHGAVWTAMANHIRLGLPAQDTWSSMHGQLAVSNWRGDAEMLAHIAHGIGHGVAIGALAKNSTLNANETLASMRMESFAHAHFGACKPAAVVDVSLKDIDHAMGICNAAPTRQLAHVCAGGAYMGFSLMARRMPDERWSDPCTAAPFPALCFHFLLHEAYGRKRIDLMLLASKLREAEASPKDGLPAGGRGRPSATIDDGRLPVGLRGVPVRQWCRGPELASEAHRLGCTFALAGGLASAYASASAPDPGRWGQETGVSVVEAICAAIAPLHSPDGPEPSRVSSDHWLACVSGTAYRLAMNVQRAKRSLEDIQYHCGLLLTPPGSIEGHQSIHHVRSHLRVEAASICERMASARMPTNATGTSVHWHSLEIFNLTVLGDNR